MERRSFLSTLVAGATGLILPDWGQRVFPMFPRVETMRIGDEAFWNAALELKLPWWEMRKYQEWLMERSARHDSTKSLCGQGAWINRSYDELIAEGWKPTELHLPGGPLVKGAGSVSYARENRRLSIPMDALNTERDGSVDWLMREHRYGPLVGRRWVDRSTGRFYRRSLLAGGGYRRVES